MTAEQIVAARLRSRARTERFIILVLGSMEAFAIGAKLAGASDHMSWWWVLSPIWVPLALMVALVFCAVTYAVVTELRESAEN